MIGGYTMKRMNRLRQQERAAAERRLSDDAQAAGMPSDLVCLGVSVALFALAAFIHSEAIVGLALIGLGVSLARIGVRCHRVGVVWERTRPWFSFGGSRTVPVRRAEHPVRYHILLAFLSGVTLAFIGGGLTVCLRGFFVSR
jgi:hypothetical protein